MGVGFSTNKIIHNVTGYVTGRKRKIRDCEDEDVDKVIDLALHTPKRKKLLSTVQYIYQALFEEGKNSDITVCALDEEFHLHKIYLFQSPYFASMFGGSWVETTKDYITIDIIDPLITVESLRTVFGSLYNCEIVLEPLGIVSTLATATMLQLEGLIEKCTEVMLETINPKTSVEYYRAACQYGDKKIQEKCFRWFLVNLMTYYFSEPLTNLKTLPMDLMSKLVEHPDLFVMQTEYSVYVMLKYWMFMQLNNDYTELSCKVVNSFYSSKDQTVPFLLTSEGKKYLSVYKGLRLHNLMSQKLDIDVVLKDNIIPKSWINPVILQQWTNVLRVDQNEDKGPLNVSDEHFLTSSLRCGRVLQVKERHVWRWTGFHFGVDLIMIADGISFSIRRNNRSEYAHLLSSQTTRRLTIRVTAVQLNQQRQIVYLKRSEILSLNLTKGEEVQIMTLDTNIEYPIIISANILYISPDQESSNEVEPVQSVT